MVEPGHTAETDSLVRAAADGDASALDVLWRTHRRWVAAVLLAHMPRSVPAGLTGPVGGVDLEDLLQDVAMTLVSKISELREPGAFRPWLRTVAISVARTAGRRQRRRGSAWLKLTGSGRGPGAEALPNDGLPGVPRRGATPAAATSERDEGRRLVDLAHELPEGYREPLLLRCVRGMSYRQIGDLMGLPETTIETRIARGRRMLREKADQDRAAGGEVMVAGSGTEGGDR